MPDKEQYHDKDTSFYEDIQNDDKEEQAKKMLDMKEGNGEVRIM